MAAATTAALSLSFALGCFFFLFFFLATICLSINCLSTQSTEHPGHFIHRCPKSWRAHTHTHVRTEPRYKRQILTLRSISAAIGAAARLVQCKKVTSSARASESGAVRAARPLQPAARNEKQWKWILANVPLCGTPSDQRLHWKTVHWTITRIFFYKLLKKGRELLKMAKKYRSLLFSSSQIALPCLFMRKGNKAC